jgi:hypothetical protein
MGYAGHDTEEALEQARKALSVVNSKADGKK